MNNKILSLSVIFLLALSVLPLVIADGASTGGDVTVGVESDNAPIICKDNTQRSWYPNDQTIKTAEIYGDLGNNLYGDDFYEVDARGDYIFGGETISYYVYAADQDGEDNIEDVTLMRNGVAIGNCNLEDDSVDPSADLDSFDCNPNDLNDLSSGDGSIYTCTVAIQNSWSGDSEFTVVVTDEEGNTDESTADRLAVNPDLSVTLSGSVAFGTVEEGDEVTSNTVFLNNVGSDGVVMDMYIGSDDYFTDSTTPDALCVNENGGAATNGIHHTQFSYYATKGSLDSGDNDATSNGLGTEAVADGYCEANDDEYTTLPSYSGDIEDDCRIINHREDGSLLTQGQSMSLTFQLEVPSVCKGSFNDGQFHFTGRVV